MLDLDCNTKCLALFTHVRDMEVLRARGPISKAELSREMSAEKGNAA